MKKLALLAAVTACLSVALPASAGLITFATPLTNVGEPVPTSTATGSAFVTFDDLAGTVSVNLVWVGLANPMPFGHIHCCTAAAFTGNASVMLDFGLLQAATTGSLNNVYTPTLTVFNTLLAGARDGKAYANIHTPGTYQGGEIRGFLRAVPEPASLALVAAALGVAGAATRRKTAQPLA